ncbi:MAG: acyl-CoA dehydrogenase, partial [Myxococcota bacterium]
FHMMNEARIGVGLGASMLGYAGYLFSLEYAKERPQGRPVTNKDPSADPVSIIEHADVRRMLLAQKAYVEGGLALGLYCARLVDDASVARAEGDEQGAERAHVLLELLTPIAKAWPSEYCLEANKLAIQVLGGYGYSREYPVERFYRDNRLNAIHEGTNGIQALDLLGRKVTMKSGEGLRLLMGEVHKALAKGRGHERLASDVAALESAVERAGATTTALGAVALGGDIEGYLANASLYLEVLGHVVVGWLWLEQGIVAARALSGALSERDEHFYRGKLSACRYFMNYELPRVHWKGELLARVDRTTLEMDARWF